MDFMLTDNTMIVDKARDTLSSSDSMRRHPQVNAGCCSSATCSSLLAKAAILLLLTSPFIALNTKDRNMGDLPDLAASGCSRTAYSALHAFTWMQLALAR